MRDEYIRRLIKKNNNSNNNAKNNNANNANDNNINKQTQTMYTNKETVSSIKSNLQKG